MRALPRLAAGLLAALTACNTPTIPIPPPEPEPEDVVVAVDVDDPGKLVFSGEPQSAGARLSFPGRALVTIYDLDSDHGAVVLADDDGRFTSDPITGQVGDRVHIWYEVEGEVSDELCLIVALGRQGRENVCALGSAYLVRVDSDGR